MSNMIVNQFMGILKLTVKIRIDVLDTLTDADLAYKLPGTNPTLGELFKEIGEMIHIYTESFQIFELDYTYHHSNEVCSTVAALQIWFKELDDKLYTVLENLTDEQINTRTIKRPHFGEAFPVSVNFHTLREGFLIYYGKLSCYLKAMDKTLPQQMQNWIG